MGDDAIPDGSFEDASEPGEVEGAGVLREFEVGAGEEATNPSVGDIIVGEVGEAGVIGGECGAGSLIGVDGGGVLEALGGILEDVFECGTAGCVAGGDEEAVTNTNCGEQTGGRFSEEREQGGFRIGEAFGDEVVENLLVRVLDDA